MPHVPSRRIVGFPAWAWSCLAVILTVAPLSAREPIRLPAERVSVSPKFEPEGLHNGFEAGEALPAATLTTRAGDTFATCLAYSPDGSSVAVGYGPTRPICTFPGEPPVNENGGLIRIVDVATREVTRTLRPNKQPRHEYDVVSLAYTPDGRTLDEHGKESWPKEGNGREYGYHLTTWDLGTGRVVRRIDSAKLDDWKLPTFSPDASTFAAKTNEGVRVWDVASGRQDPSPEGAPVGPVVLAFSPNGKVLATGEENGEVGLWDVASGRRIARFSGHRQDEKAFEVCSLTFSPDGRTMACGGLLRIQIGEFLWKHVSELRLLDLSTNRERATIPCGDPDIFHAVAFSPDGNALVTASSDGRGWDGDDRDGVLRCWDAATGRQRAAVTRIEGAGPIVYSRDGSFLVTSGRESMVIRDPIDGRERFALHQDFSFSQDARIALSPDGRTLASTNGTFHLWDLRAAAEPPIRGGHRFEVTCLAYAPDGRTLASASVDRTVKLWDVEARRPRATLLGHADDVVRLAYAPDGQTVASVDAQGSVRIWDTTTGTCRATLRGPEIPPQILAFAPDGRALTLMAGSHGKPAEARRWDVTSGEPLPTGDLAASLSPPFAFSHDGRLIVSANKERIEIRDAANGGLRPEFSGKEESLTLLLSRDGETVIRLTQHHSIVIHRRSAGTWRAETLFADEELGIELGTYVPGLRMTATPDARILAAKIEGTVQVFDTVKLKPIAEFPDVEGDVTWLALSPDGRSLATGRADGEIVIYDLVKAVAPVLKP